MIQRCVRAFTALPLSEIVVVTGFYHDELMLLTFDPVVRVVHNRNYTKGMSSSVRCGLLSLQEEVKGVLVCPADMPLIQSATVVQMIQAFHPGKIVIPLYRGKRGHPVLLSWDVAHWCRESESDRVLPDALERFKSNVVEVDVEDEGVAMDIDDPKDYEACVARWDQFNGRSGL